MADNIGTHGAPGIAAFDAETFGNVRELRLQDSPATASQRVTITNGTGSVMALPIFSVVSLTGLAVSVAAVAAQAGPPSVPAQPLSSDAVGILPYPVSIGIGGSMQVDVIVAGYFDFNALNWGASFDSDTKKKAAFDNRPAPINIILDTNPFTSDGVLA